MLLLQATRPKLCGAEGAECSVWSSKSLSLFFNDRGRLFGLNGRAGNVLRYEDRLAEGY